MTGIISSPLPFFIKDNYSERRQLFAKGERRKYGAEHSDNLFRSADTFITPAHLEYSLFWHRIGCMQPLLLAGSLTFLFFFLSLNCSLTVSPFLLRLPLSLHTYI